MKAFATGAEAVLYETTFDGRKALLKVRGEKPYRVKELDALLRRQRTRREAKALRAARSAGVNCAELLSDDEEKNELTLLKSSGVLLSREKKISEKQARQAGEQLAKLHNAGIVHGDFTTSNLMADASGNVVVIDFGLSEFSASEEDRATDVLLFEKSLGGLTNEKHLTAAFESGYSSLCKDHPKVFGRLKQVIARGRYVSSRQ